MPSEKLDGPWIAVKFFTFATPTLVVLLQKHPTGLDWESAEEGGQNSSHFHPVLFLGLMENFSHGHHTGLSPSLSDDLAHSDHHGRFGPRSLYPYGDVVMNGDQELTVTFPKILEIGNGWYSGHAGGTEISKRCPLVATAHTSAARTSPTTAGAGADIRLAIEHPLSGSSSEGLGNQKPAGWGGSV